MANTEGVIFITCWVAMLVGYGLWMIIWPEKYWKSWKNHLKGGDPFERWFPGRTAALGDHLRTRNPRRKARVLGSLFILAGLVGGALFLYGKSLKK